MDTHAIKKVKLFTPFRSQYSVLHNFTKCLHESFLSLGVDSEILEAQKNNPEPFLKSLLNDSPQCTISFNGLLPFDNGDFFSDLIKVPHIALLVDPPTTFFPLTRSKYTIIGSVDGFWNDFFRESGFKNCFFMPHGADKKNLSKPDSKKKFDCLMLSSFIDYESIAANWKKEYGKTFSNIMEEACEECLQNSSQSFLKVFLGAINKQAQTKEGKAPHEIDLISIMNQFETYLKAKDRLELIKNLEVDKIDIFGASIDSDKSWKHYIKQKHVKIHDPVSFDEALKLMKQSKIVLNSCATIRYGAHERVLSGLLAGSLVLTSDNAYLSECFDSNKGIVFYRYGEWDKMNKALQSPLKDETHRQECVHKGQSIVLDQHLWENRAKQLLEILPTFLANI